MNLQNNTIRVSFVVPSWHYYADPTKHQPYWELYYATHLKNAGLNVDVIDLRISASDSFEDMAKSIKEADFYFYWIFKTGDALEIYSIVKILKNRFPKSIHAAGGTHVDKTPDDAKNHLDAIVIGPGEKSFINIINDQISNNLLKVYASNYPDVPFSETLIPNRDFLPKEVIVNNKLFTGYADVPATLTYFSRGCIYKCSYCTYNVPNALQVRTPIQIKDEISYLKDTYSIKGILVKDEVAINPNKKICTETLNALKESDIIWRGQTTTLATLDQLKHAADSGCLELAIGVETADENVMKLIDKTWQDRKQILDFAKNARQVGIKIKVCLILGLPGEPRDIVRKTINLLEELKPNFASVSGFLPVPGSPIANNPNKFGIKKIDKDWHKYSHLLFRFADNEEVGLPFEYDTSENSINVFTRQEIIENIIEVQKWLKDRGMVY